MLRMVAPALCGREGVAKSVAKHRPLFAPWKQTSEERMDGHHLAPSNAEWADDMVGKLQRDLLKQSH